MTVVIEPMTSNPNYYLQRQQQGCLICMINLCMGLLMKVVSVPEAVDILKKVQRENVKIEFVSSLRSCCFMS